MSEQYYKTFENWITKLFIKADYVVEQNYIFKELKTEADLVIEKDNIKYCVEIKYSQMNENIIDKIYYIAKQKNMVPIIVCPIQLKKGILNKYKKKYPNLIILDIQNLLYAVRYSIKMKNELAAILPFSIEKIEPKKGFISIDALQHNNYTESLINELKSCNTGSEFFRDFEDICLDFLKNLFSDDLTLWRTQEKSNNGLYRFDLLCRIKDGNQKSFWSILERYFNSKYVIFEFKNYKEKITQREIYTTEKYLYAKALRSVAIIISANGTDDNAYWATKGCLRENGKLILLLSSNDLIEMNKMKLDNEEPSEYLLSKLDDLLMELEK